MERPTPRVATSRLGTPGTARLNTGRALMGPPSERIDTAEMTERRTARAAPGDTAAAEVVRRQMKPQTAELMAPHPLSRTRSTAGFPEVTMKDLWRLRGRIMRGGTVVPAEVPGTEAQTPFSQWLVNTGTTQLYQQHQRRRGPLARAPSMPELTQTFGSLPGAMQTKSQRFPRGSHEVGRATDRWADKGCLRPPQHSINESTGTKRAIGILGSQIERCVRNPGLIPMTGELARDKRLASFPDFRRTM
mmetsp:Transcript_43998/g.80505  ORF Transcript_43998/g.80505 Transcript_43998/m.80505 type:complete len:247 (-) Transcript_43998:2-742(-)